MNKFALIAACSLLAFPALAASMGEKTGINSTLGISPASKDFVQEAAISDMFEIESSKLPTGKLAVPEKQFADQMITDHTKTSFELARQAKSADIAVPSVLDAKHQKLLDSLKKRRSEDFRKEYFSDQVSGHEDAVSLFKRYAGGGDNAGLKSWAGATLPALEHHLEMARSLYKAD